jgi:N-acetyl-anhydromuramyl-L-alanine amidase AmpD
VDYPPAIWRPSPNFNQRAGDEHFVIIHTCEGSYTGCWSWLVNPASNVSSHYVVDEEGTEISQLVRERDRAWHIAARYDCTLNYGQDCQLNDIQSNHITIGIEHAGYASQAAWPLNQIDASAALVCDITRDNDIPRDWQHVVGHGQLQPNNRTDPGANWPWVFYMHTIQRHCGEVVVDDEGSLNDASVAATVIDTPTEWTATNLTAGYYGDGYRWAATQEDATDGIAFSFFVESTDSMSVDARWTSGSNRTPQAQYVVIDAAGDTLGDVRMDQTSGGNEWHNLGRWEFPAGWNQVVLQRRDAPGWVVVADAVRARRD